MVFDNDPNNNPNDPSAGGGNPDPEPKGGGGGGQPEPAKAPPEPEKIEITVDGEKRQITMEEAIDLAQKAAGAGKKFEDAAKMRKEAENGLRLMELVGRFNDENHESTEAELREMALALGIDAEEFMANLKDAEGNQDGDKGNTQKSTQFDFDAEFQKRFGKTPAEAKAAQDYTDQFHIERAKEKIRDTSDKKVDKDEIFGKMIVGEGGDDRLSVIKDMVADEVLVRIQGGTPLDQAVTESIQKIRSYLTKFGIQGKPDQYPMTLGLVPGQNLPSEVMTDEPIKRKTADEDDAEDNFIKRKQQQILSMLRSGAKK